MPDFEEVVVDHVPVSSELVTYVVPLIIKLIGQFKHRNDELTAEEVEAAFHKELADARSVGNEFIIKKQAKG